MTNQKSNIFFCMAAGHKYPEHFSMTEAGEKFFTF